MLQTNDIAILDETNGVLCAVFGLFPLGKDDPFVVIILVVIAGDLLLRRTGGVGLDVRMQETTAVANVLERKL